MPMHDWTRVDVGTFHDFHQGWAVYLSRSLNAGLLPNGFHSRIEYRPRDLYREYDPRESDAAVYARRVNRIAIHAADDRIVALISIVSPGNRESTRAIRRFLSQLVGYLDRGIELLVVDPLLPTPAAPIAVHQLVQKIRGGTPSASSNTERPMSIASFRANPATDCIVEMFDLGEPIPDGIVTLNRDEVVRVPLDSTYQHAWNALPEITRQLVLSPPPA